MVTADTTNFRMNEASFLSEFETTLRHSRGRQESHTRLRLHEFDGIQGRADMVEAVIRALPANIDLDSLADSLVSPTKASILANLQVRVPRSRAYIANATGIREQVLRRYVRQLAEVNLVQIHENSSVSLTCRLPWSMVEIVSYEAKLYDWRRALHQAIGYRAFSHSVRVIMPATSAARAQQITNVFRQIGVGLIAVEKDGRVSVKIRSRKRRPASRRLYLMAVGKVLKKFVGDRRRLHRKLRPESIQSL